MHKYLNFFRENDLLAKHLNMDLIEITPGGSKVRMPVQKIHLNGVQTAHGGAIFTLADFAFAAASNSHGEVSVAIQTSITFHKAVTEGTVLIAEAKEIYRNPKLGSYQIDVKTEEGDLVATFQGLAYRKKDTLESFMSPNPR